MQLVSHASFPSASSCGARRARHVAEAAGPVLDPGLPGGLEVVLAVAPSEDDTARRWVPAWPWPTSGCAWSTTSTVGGGAEPSDRPGQGNRRGTGRRPRGRASRVPAPRRGASGGHWRGVVGACSTRSGIRPASSSGGSDVVALRCGRGVVGPAAGPVPPTPIASGSPAARLWSTHSTGSPRRREDSAPATPPVP